MSAWGETFGWDAVSGVQGQQSACTARFRLLLAADTQTPHARCAHRCQRLAVSNRPPQVRCSNLYRTLLPPLAVPGTAPVPLP